MRPGPVILSLAIPALLPCAGCLFGLSAKEEKALSLYSNQAKYWYDNQRYREARQQAEKGLKIDDGNYGLNMLMGWTLLQLGGRENAFRSTLYFDICDSKNIFSSDWKLQLGYGVAYQRQGKFYQLAMLEEQKLAAQGGDAARRAQHLARAKHFEASMHERYAKAIEILEEVAREREMEDVAVDNLQQIYANLGKYDKALEYSDILVRNANRKLSEQEEFLLRNDLPPAGEDLVLETIRKVKKRVAEIRGLRANIYHKQGRDKEAITELDDILTRLDPQNTVEYYNRAECRQAVGDREGAIGDYLRFLRRAGTRTDQNKVDQAYSRLSTMGVDVDKLVRLQVEQVKSELLPASSKPDEPKSGEETQPVEKKR